MARSRSVWASIAAAAWAATCRVSLAVVTPHLMWMGPSRWKFPEKSAKDARVVATSHIAVSSTPPQYPPKMGICSIMMVSPTVVQPANMLRPVMSIFSSFSWEHSCGSVILCPALGRSAHRRPASDRGVSGP